MPAHRRSELKLNPWVWLALAMWLIPGLARADRVAVLEIGGDGSISEAGLEFLADKVRGEALRHLEGSGWEVITRENMLVLLQANASDLAACEGECEVETGRLLGAQLVVAGSVVRLGTKYRITLKSFRTDSGLLIGGEDNSADDIDGLVDGLPGIGAQLFEDTGWSEAGSGSRIGRGRVVHGLDLDRGEDIVNRLTDETGFLVVRAEPANATILVNGEEVGSGSVQLERMVGRYVVVAELGGLYHPAREEILLGAEGARVVLTLTPAFGALKVASSPQGAEIWLDDDRVGITPWSAERQRSGTYDLRLALEDHHDHTARVRVRDGDTTDVRIDLRPSVGRLRITSEPVGAEVWLDGERVGKTPWADDRRDSGIYELRVILTDYLSHSEMLTIVDGEIMERHCRLDPNFGDLLVKSTPP